jgi:hypothetical protein
VERSKAISMVGSLEKRRFSNSRLPEPPPLGATADDMFSIVVAKAVRLR